MSEASVGPKQSNFAKPPGSAIEEARGGSASHNRVVRMLNRIAEQAASGDRRLIRRAVLAWWAKNKRDYPWRSYQNPWHVLLAEVLLRKTNAEKVARLIPQMVEAFPTPHSVLSRCDDLERLLKPFGMHRRKAGELKKLAEVLVTRHMGRVPNTLEDLRKLPGVGDYIGNAVLCFGFGRRVPIVDVNVIRVLSDLFGMKSCRSRPRSDPKVWEFVRDLLPKRRFKEFNWALLDLGKSLKELKGEVRT